MKIGVTDQTIIRGDVGEENRFRIRANARAFSILSSNLYRNKIKAVIRELSCNAVDSHKAANNPEPFVVHMPSTFEPWFSVTDFGLGLSHEQVMDIYTTYFASTKSDSNDYIGALGLGSKSPFAYTTTYDVNAIKDGVSNSYCMFISETGEPAVTHMGSKTTDARNGVTVKVPVKSFDFYNFESNASEVFSWFDLKPTVLNNSYFSIIDREKLLSGNGWYLAKTSSSYTVPMALMGNVAYPINREQVDKKFTGMLMHAFVIDFNIGELDVTASREELSYDPVTVGVLNKRLEKVMEELCEIVNQKISGAPSLWDARVAYHKLSSDYQTREILSMLNGSNFQIHWGNNANAVQDKELRWSHLFQKPDNMTVEETVEWVKNKPEVWKHKGRLESVDSIMVNDDTVFIRKNVYDTSGRVRLLRSANPNTTYYVIEAGDDNFSILQDFLGFSDFILSSTLPKPPKKSMKFKAKKHTSSYSHHRRSSAWDDGDDTELDIAVEETHYYVRLASNYAVVIDAVDAVGDKVEHQIDDFGKAVYLAMELDIIPRDMTIWGLNKTNTKLVADDDNWVEAWGYIVDKVKEYLDGIVKNDLIDNEEDLRRITNSFYYLGKKSFVGTFGQMNNAVGEFAREWESAVHQKSLAKFDPNMIGMITNLAFMCKIPFQRPTYQKSSLMVSYEKMNTEYPLMEYVNNGRMHLQDFKEYILALDNMKKASNI